MDEEKHPYCPYARYDHGTTDARTCTAARQQLQAKWGSGGDRPAGSEECGAAAQSAEVGHVYCKDSRRPATDMTRASRLLLGLYLRPRRSRAKNRDGELFDGFLTAVSLEAIGNVRHDQEWKLRDKPGQVVSCILVTTR